MRRVACTVAFSAAMLFAAVAPARAYCPSYTPAQTSGGKNCGVEPQAGKNPSTAEWKAIIAKVAGGKASWAADGPDIQSLNAGCGKPIVRHAVDAHFPCIVLGAIAMQESGWKQFCVPESPAQSIGAPERTLVSFDCGYGVGQVTSGMHAGEATSFDRARVAADPTYNLATGTLLLRSKWAATSCVGDNNPDVVEDWYSAIWAYNGLSYSNNPNNPNLGAGRGPYDPKNGGSYTYQERVLGWMEHPPSAAHWPAIAVAYPNRGDLGTKGAPPELPAPSCASPTSCAKTRPTHVATCDGEVASRDGGAFDDAGSSIVLEAGATPVPDKGDGVEGAPQETPQDVPQRSDGCACRVTRAEAPGADGRLVLSSACLLVLGFRRRARRG